MRRVLLLLLALVATALPLGAAVAPAQAINDGRLDGDGHPYVGLLVNQDADGNPLSRCTGTLISPTLFVTAGHCTFESGRSEIWFDSGPVPTDPRFDAAAEDPCANVTTKGYPCIGDVGGTPYTHPDYDDAQFWLHDLGVVVLDEPVTGLGYGELPELHQLDGLKAGKKNGQIFTSVGYGLQKAFPDASSYKDEAAKTRYVANPRLIQINTNYVGDWAITLSNNANTGGTCFGDSGGPNFIGTSNVLGGVTSYGKNNTCGGQGGVYRLDQEDDLTWLATFGAV